MRIGKIIALELKKTGIEICDDFYQRMMQFVNYRELAGMYFKGSDWSMKNDFPNLELLRNHKGALMLEGMITDGNEVYDNMRFLGVFGDSDVQINYNKFNIGREIIIRHNSKAKITASDNSILTINLLDNASVQIECTDNATVFVYVYGSLDNVKYAGNVVVKKKSWEK